MKIGTLDKKLTIQPETFVLPRKTMLLATIILAIAACQSPRQGYIRGILGGVCFWDVLDEDLHTENARYTYRFLTDGKCYKYHYDYVAHKRQNSVYPVDKDKGEVDIGWSLKNDSVLTIGTDDYKVVKAENNRVWLETSSAQSVLLQKNCSTFIID